MEDTGSILEEFYTKEAEATYIERIASILLDLVFEITTMIALYFLVPRTLLINLFGINPYMRYLIALAIVFVYRTTCILLLGKTIGMLLCRVKYLNHKLQPLSQNEKLIAIFATRTSKVKFYKVK